MRSVEKPLAPVPARIAPRQALEIPLQIYQGCICLSTGREIGKGEVGASSPPASAVPGRQARAGGDLVSLHLAGSR